MEIFQLYPYYTAQSAAEPDGQISGGQKTSKNSEANVADLREAEDRLELVRTQNLASPPSVPVDLTKAAELLGQVQDQMQLLEKQDARELYQYDRLRDLLYRVSQTQGV
uniref:Uncharacterized protein n=1 Tax=Desulfobacca acetoxidans TaxID=60893 RepID=A0A7C3V6Z0_9BACT